MSKAFTVKCLKMRPGKKRVKNFIKLPKVKIILVKHGFVVFFYLFYLLLVFLTLHSRVLEKLIEFYDVENLFFFFFSSLYLFGSVTRNRAFSFDFYFNIFSFNIKLREKKC